MSLVIDLVRHGDATPAGSAGDSQRGLSPLGARRIARLGERLAGEGWKPDHVFSSPLKRACETAEIVCGTAHAPVARPIRALEPDAEPMEVLTALLAQGIEAGHVVLVGHQPLLGRLAGYLTGMELGLAPGGLIRIACPAGPGQSRGRVVLVLTPEDYD